MEEQCPHCQKKLPPREEIIQLVDEPMGVPVRTVAASSDFYMLRRKSDGLYATGVGGRFAEKDKAKVFSTRSTLVRHLLSYSPFYGSQQRTQWHDIEVIPFKCSAEPALPSQSFRDGIDRHFAKRARMVRSSHHSTGPLAGLTGDAFLNALTNM